MTYTCKINLFIPIYLCIFNHEIFYNVLGYLFNSREMKIILEQKILNIYSNYYELK